MATANEKRLDERLGSVVTLLAKLQDVGSFKKSVSSL